MKAKCKRLMAFLLSCILIMSSMTVYAAEDSSLPSQEHYTLTVKSEHGSVDVTGDGVTQTGKNEYDVLTESEITVKAEPEEGYTISEMTLNDVVMDYKSDNTLSFKMPMQDSQFNVSFTEIKEAADQETTDQDTADQDAVDQDTADQDVADQDTADQEAADQDTADQDAVDQDAADQDAADQDTADQETADQDAADQETADQETTDQDAADQETTDQDAVEKYDITFRVHGDGVVNLEYQDQEPVTINEDESKTLSLDVDSFINVIAKSETEKNISIAVSNEDGITLEPTLTKRTESLSREITVTETEKIIDISFSDTTLDKLIIPPLLTMATRGSEQQPEVGDKFSGNLTVVSVDGGGGHTVHSVTIRATSGILQGEGTFDVDCAQHSAAAPTSGMTYSYTYTITSVDESSGRVTGNLYAISHTQPSDGVTTDENGNLIGYQALSGTIKITREYNGSLKLLKTSTNTDITNGNSNYSLAGAVYGVYSDRSCTKRVATLTTTASGSSNTVSITAGQYYVKEITAPKGYALDKTVYSVTVTAGQTATVRVTDYPQSDPVSILLGKVDAETTANMPQGSASLEGAEFTVKYYDGYYSSTPSVSPTRTWVLKTDADGFCWLNKDYVVSGDDLFLNSSGTPTLPLGTITIQETKAPEGYLLNDEVFVRQITAEGTAEGVNTYNEPTIPEDVIRGDLQLVKFSESNDDQKQPLEGIIFEITSKTTGETVEIVTDENGYATTEQLGNEKGGLAYDTYIVHEKNTPEGLEPVDDFEITISEAGQTLYYILEDKQVVSPVKLVKVDSTTGQTIPIADTEFQLLDSDKNPISLTTYYPNEEVHETFKTDATGSFTLPEKLPAGIYYFREVNAPDGYLLNGEDLQFEITESHDWDEPLVVTFEDTPAMGKIRIKKTDAETDKPIPEGAEFTITAAEDIVTPDGTVRVEAGTVVDTVTTDDNGMAETDKLYLGKYIVSETKAPEGYLLNAQKYEVELVYKDQNTEIVYADVTVTDSPAMGKIKIIKTDEYTGDTLADGVFEISAAEDIVTPDGTVRVEAGTVVDTLTTDSSGQAQSINLYLGKYLIKEIDQPDGYILPEEGTTWEVELKYNDQTTSVVTEELKIENRPTVVIIDKKVTGSEERLSGVKFVIWNKDKEDPIDPGMTYKDVYKTARNGQIRIEGLEAGNYCVAEVETVPGYSFDKDKIYEFTIAEDGRIDGKEELTITVENAKTEITETNVVNADTDNQMAYPQNITAVDTVSMVNLQPGTEYTLKGVLMNQQTGEPIAVEPVEQKFTATDTNMDVDVTFTFDASEYAGQTIVVFEYLYQDGLEISSHTDLNDTKQQLTIMVPELHTTAIDLESGTHEAIAKEDITIRDNIDYTDIIPGTYTLKGILMDQSTGEPLLVNGKQVTAEKEVQITEENGTLTMDFTFDASELNGKSTVVFEYLYPHTNDDTPVASHEDINDEDQTVSFKVGTLIPSLPNQGGSGMNAPQTGDNLTLYYVLGMMCLAIGVGAVTYVIRKKKKVNENEK